MHFRCIISGKIGTSRCKYCFVPRNIELALSLYFVNNQNVGMYVRIMNTVLGAIGFSLSDVRIVLLQVLDEMLRVLRSLSDVTREPRTHELLQELRDISSMAMEHFDEKIVPGLRARMPSSDTCLGLSLPPLNSPLTPTSKHNFQFRSLLLMPFKFFCIIIVFFVT